MMESSPVNAINMFFLQLLDQEGEIVIIIEHPRLLSGLVCKILSRWARETSKTPGSVITF